MKSTSLVLALPAIVLTGCVTEKAIDPDVACRDRTITLNHIPHASISITHPTVDMCGGQTLTIRLRPSVPAAESAPGAESGPIWLNAMANADGSEMMIMVPEGLPSGAEFDYTLTLPGVGVLDPTIRIIP